MVERIFRLFDLIFGAKQKAKERMRGWIARRKLESFLESFFRLRYPAKAKLQFCDAGPGKAKITINGCRVFCCFEGARKIGLGLEVIRFCEPIACGLGR